MIKITFEKILATNQKEKENRVFIPTHQNKATFNENNIKS